MRVLCYNLLLFFLLISCQGKVVKTNQALSDTARIIEIALEEGTSGKYMPDVSPLSRKYRFGDSILLTSNVLPLDMLPPITRGHVFKIMSQQDICSIIKQDSSLEEVPNYLMISRFEKNDSGYYAQVQSLDCRPYGDGGSLGIYFKKIKDSLVVVDRGSWSIN